MTTGSEEHEASFEELQRELEDIVARLERGDVPVDEAIALYRRGEEVYRTCVERLETAQLEIEELTPTTGTETEAAENRDRGRRDRV